MLTAVVYINSRYRKVATGMINIERKNVFGSVFIVFMLLSGCNNNGFKDCCLTTKSILLNGMQLLIVDNEENEIVDGKIVSTTTKFNNEKTMKYIESKKKELLGCYEIIKDNYRQSNANATDALFVLALVNEITTFICGKPIEDRCAYVIIIKKKDSHRLSKWVMDEVFGPILRTDKELFKEWFRMDNKSKYQEIYDFLTLPYQNYKGCD